MRHANSGAKPAAAFLLKGTPQLRGRRPASRIVPPAFHSVSLKCALDTPPAPSPGSAFTTPRGGRSRRDLFTTPRGGGSRRDLMFAPACAAPTLPRSPSHARLAEAPLRPPPSPLHGLGLATPRRFSLACGQQKALRTRRESLGNCGASFAEALQPPASEWGLGTSIREDDFTPVRVSWQPEARPQAASGSPELVRVHSV